MKLPLNSSQTIAALAIGGVLLGGAFALGKMNNGNAAAPPPAQAVVDEQPAPPKAGSTAAKAGLCKGCLRVVDLHTEERASKTSGVGVVGGAVLGGLIGSQIGGGNGKKLATVGGAVAGGYAGNEIEKRRNSHKVWVVQLSDEQGRQRSHEQASNPNLQAGDVVELREGQLQRR